MKSPVDWRMKQDRNGLRQFGLPGLRLLGEGRILRSHAVKDRAKKNCLGGFIFFITIFLAAAVQAAPATEAKQSPSEKPLVSKESKPEVFTGFKKALTSKPKEAQAPAKAKEKEEDKDVKREMKTVKGMVVNAFKDTLSLEISSSETEGAQEMLMTLDKGTKLEKVKKISELKYGDEVKVDYEIATKENKVGEEMVSKTVGTTAKKVTLLKKAADLRSSAISGSGDEE